MVSHSSEGPHDATGPGSGPGSASSAGALPRSALLALWLRAARLGDDDGLARLLRAVQRDDEPHVVSGALGDLRLEDLAGAWAGDAREVVALAPVPGDVAGVPPEAAARATDAGECVVVTTSSGSWALVPEVAEFGSDLEPGHLVTWHVTSVGPWSTRVLGALGSLAEAERDLRTALLLATRALDELDVARWRDDAAGALADLRAGGVPAWQLPRVRPPARRPGPHPGSPPPRHRRPRHRRRRRVRQPLAGRPALHRPARGRPRLPPRPRRRHPLDRRLLTLREIDPHVARSAF